MVILTQFPKRAHVSEEDSSLDGTVGREDEKTIPFLRRLRDMLTENESSISFSPGRMENEQPILGRIVVHDRVTVESKVLPRYFNHSSFASLRRQLNYFSFVRLGKGRQRESTYVNENVVALDDILHLKRRSAGAAPSKEPAATAVRAVVVARTTKRRRLNRTTTTTTTTTPRASSPVNNLISEDERSESKHHYMPALDLTKPSNNGTDDDILAGCNALLKLASRGWN